MLPEIDIAGQQRLLSSRVLLLGVGGLGCVVAQYLTSCGVGQLTIVDDDRVELSNLQRQILFTTADVGKSKAEVAKQRLSALNEEVRIDAIHARLQGDELNEAIANADLVIDGTDNFASRFLHNSACVRQKRALVSGAVIRFEGQVTVFPLHQTSSPCYHCLYPGSGELDQSCANNGVLGPVVGTVGSLMATEAIKVLLNLDGVLDAKLLLIDALHVQWRQVRFKKDPACSICQ